MEKEEDFDKAFEEMMKALKDLPPDVVGQLNKNLAKIKQEEKNKKKK